MAATSLSPNEMFITRGDERVILLAADELLMRIQRERVHGARSVPRNIEPNADGTITVVFRRYDKEALAEIDAQLERALVAISRIRNLFAIQISDEHPAGPWETTH